MEIWLHRVRQHWGTFSLRMHKIGYFGSFWSKILPHCSIQRPRFPIRRVYFHHRMTFAVYIWCFWTQFSCDRVTLALNFWSHVLCVIHPTQITILRILRLSVPDILISQWLIFHQCACAVSRDLSLEAELPLYLRMPTKKSPNRWEKCMPIEELLICYRKPGSPEQV